MSIQSHEHFALILAAGQSTRMGQDKASLPWLNGRQLLIWMVDTLADAGWTPIVVVGVHNYEHWKAQLPESTVALNLKSLEGKITSIARGLEVMPASAKSIMITSVDQPRPQALYRLLRAASEIHQHSIITPDKHGRNGHPITITGDLINQLSFLQESSEGLRGFLRENQEAIRRVPCDPEWLIWDFNTLDAYFEALQWFQSHSKTN